MEDKKNYFVSEEVQNLPLFDNDLTFWSDLEKDENSVRILNNAVYFNNKRNQGNENIRRIISLAEYKEETKKRLELLPKIYQIIKTIMESHGIKEVEIKVKVFGSLAAGRCHKNSDIDLIIYRFGLEDRHKTLDNFRKFDNIFNEIKNSIISANFGVIVNVSKFHKLNEINELVIGKNTIKIF